MKLTSRYDMSKWAYFQCLNGNDTQEMRDLIVSAFWIYEYCIFVRNIEEMRDKLKYCYWYRIEYDELLERAEEVKNETNK